MPSWIIDVIIFLFVVWFLSQRLMPTKGVKTISTTDLKGMLKDKNIQFVDVRTKGEYSTNHIKEFKNIPLNELPQQASQLSKDKEIVVICQSGMRSTRACKMLKKMNFDNISNVKGGMSAW